MTSKKERFIFRKHTNIGAADAIEDKKYLFSSFVNNGELDILLDQNSPKCIIAGRTGSGKTALIEVIKKSQERVISIAPEGLALNFLTNNNTIRFFLEAGVDLDLFYRLLWRHVFAVEIIKKHYKIRNKEARDSFLVKIKDYFSKHNTRKEAIEYLMDWGESFWLESEYRIKEITTTLEKDMGASAEVKLKSMIPGFKSIESSLDARVAKKLTEEQKAEIVRLTQPVVDKVQIKILTEIMSILNETLDDEQKRYFITIDRLDENWITDELRFHLIKALIDSIRDFNHKVDNAKIIIALRIDLLDRVFRYTRSNSPGYQEEKYQSMYLHLTWEEKELREVLNKRVNILVKEQYTKAPVDFYSLMPSKVKKENPSSFFFGRTMNTPRDAIQFFNLCIKHAEGKAKFNQTILLNAEKEYSSYRIGSLADEWIADYPNLIKLAFFLERFPSIFIPEEMKDRIELKMVEFLISSPQQDYIYNLIDNKFNDNEIYDFLREMINILFKVGIVGARPDNSDRFIWSFKGNVLDKATIRISRRVKIHPAFHSTLGIR